ncbi:hypothetical protein AAE02nite_15110 [Adhaeribacter aerolatus]|uniref:DUF1330 domain-containing protein n=1 Tax=Adhaeribacter aerolatus TaxID=670289 RepID=A0A512AWF4_9BACT|nr:hypothetical protein [Adhaeribacter aerolatus]GEO03847.1 hypothetical protein AAE02nite_15110 [Adhaeribacter aerolatus]
MQLIQILLPLYNNQKEPFAQTVFNEIQQELTEKFGGITSFSRAPATGLWKENEEKTVKDEIIIYEVMAETLDRNWWQHYKAILEKTFRQEEILIRAWEIQVL